MEEIDMLTKYILANGLAVEGDFLGCSHSEITQVELMAGGKLPRVYNDFLLRLGRSAGKFLSGSSIFFPEVLSLRTWAMELIQVVPAEFVLSDREYVFFMHQGYQFSFFRLDGTENPPIWYFYETWKKPREIAGTLSQYLLDLAREELESSTA